MACMAGLLTVKCLPLHRAPSGACGRTSSRAGKRLADPLRCLYRCSLRATKSLQPDTDAQRGEQLLTAPIRQSIAPFGQYRASCLATVTLATGYTIM
jgi:hypothetical protein